MTDEGVGRRSSAAAVSGIAASHQMKSAFETTPKPNRPTTHAAASQAPRQPRRTLAGTHQGSAARPPANGRVSPRQPSARVKPALYSAIGDGGAISTLAAKFCRNTSPQTSAYGLADQPTRRARAT